MSEPAQTHSAWWVRLAASLPWWLLNGLADGLAWLAWRVVKYGRPVMRENLAIAFPEFDEARLQAVMRDYYRGFGQVLVEVIKSARLPAGEISARVRLEGFDEARAALAAGSPVLLVAAHQCNWEWMLLALSLDLGYPVDAAYKPLVDGWAQREMLEVRSRFGARLVPAQEMLADILRRGREPRAIAMVADQEPRDSERRHWTRFLNRDTAFFVGAEEIARATRFPVFFVGVRRVARGRYTVSASALAAGGEKLAPGELTERYARQVEQQIRADPPNWPWTHKRWKLRRPLYGR
ncbi:MAG TPA: lysophospholipid acyltransferase family protein [Steroidobacteraceae bacterium]|nr:lysophospholipid acyltransferase family protein [Steroidobacteraceae bacterium]